MKAHLLLLAALPLAPAAAQRPPKPAPRPAPPKTVVVPRPAPRVDLAPLPIEPLIAPEAPWSSDLMIAPEPLWSLDEPPIIDAPFPPEPALWTEPLDLAFDHDLLVAPEAPLVWSVSPDGWGVGSTRIPAFAREAPNDSLYRMAREALNRGEYHRAAELFAQFEAANPSSRYVAASMYWRAFARYRAGREDDLRAAVQVLDEQRRRFPAAGDDADVRVLFTRVMGALAARGDTDAVRRLREGADQGDKPCDREEMEVRAEALSALAGTDPGSVSGVIKRVLADRDECTEPLRRRAVYLLGKTDDAGAQDALLDAAKNDPSDRVRSDAITRLAQLPGDRQVPLLAQLLAGSSDENIQMAVVGGLARSEDPAARAELRRIIEREDLSERVRVGAIRGLARAGWISLPATITVRDQEVSLTRRRESPSLTDDDATFLRSLYGRVESRAVKLAIVETMARYGGDAGDTWLMTLARDPSQDTRFRSAALSRLRRADVGVAELAKLYDTLTDRRLRSTMVDILGARTEPEATDKLLDIARQDTDPSIRRRAISALARKKDPRTTKLLLQLVEK